MTKLTILTTNEALTLLVPYKSIVALRSRLDTKELPSYGMVQSRRISDGNEIKLTLLCGPDMDVVAFSLSDVEVAFINPDTARAQWDTSWSIPSLTDVIETKYDLDAELLALTNSLQE